MKKRAWGRIVLVAMLAAVSCGFFLTHGSAADKKQTKNEKVYQKDEAGDLSRHDVIYGRVVDAATKEPLTNATVEMKNARFGLGYYRVKTDKAGRFRIADFIRHITYKIEVSADGYITRLQTENIQPGEYTFALDREGILSGVVTDSAHKPLPGVEVKLNSADVSARQSNDDDEGSSDDDGGYSGERPRFVTTGKDGGYRFNKIAAGGRYLATFTKQGYIAETAQIRQIKPGESLALPMLMYRPASVSGKLTIRDLDAPAANIDVRLEGSSTQATASYQDGTYRIDDIKPGNYKLSFLHRGFEGFETKPIAIREGQVRKNADYSLTARNPEVEVYTDRYTFVIGQQISFNLRTLRLEKFKVRIFRMPIDIVLKGRIDAANLQPARDGLQLVREWEEGVRDFAPYDWREQHIDIAQSLPTGSYCIEASGEDRTISRKIFSVTSLGIVVKRSLSSVLVYATDLAGNRPVSGAPVVLYDVTVKEKTKAEKAPARDESVAPAQPDEDEQANDREGESRDEEIAPARADDDDQGDEERPARSARSDKRKAMYSPPSRLEELPVDILAQGKTGDDGTIRFPVPPGKMLAVMAVAADGSYAFSRTGSQEEFQQEKDKIFIYTDRPVYRAGDKVHYKFVGKSMEKAPSPLKGRKLLYQIVNTDVNAVVDHGTFSFDRWGTFKKNLQLAADTRLGTYEIRAGWKESQLYSKGKFYVDQYRKPEFKVDVSAAKEFYVNRETVEFKVEAKYFFGSPLKGALARYRFYERKLQDEETTYWWEEDKEAPRAYNKIKLEGEKYLDNDGIAKLKIACGDLPYDRELTLEITIVDNSNVSVSESSTVKIGRGDYYIKIRPSQRFFAADDKKAVEIRTISHNGKPRRATVDIMVYRYLWRPWQRVYVHDQKPVFAVKVETDAAGLAKVELPDRFADYGEYDIVAQGRDKRDNLIAASRVVWIYGLGAASVESRLKNLELSVSEADLEKPGEITCLVKSRYADSTLLLTVEGKDIHEQRLVRLKGHVAAVKLDIKKEYAPNVFITATMQRGRALFTSSTEVTLPNAGINLNIDLKADREKYLPGDKAKIRIKATDEAGKPVRADISLGAVDEAIYLIRRDHTPRMRDYFYAKNSNWVLTSYSYPFTVLAGAGKEGKVKIREKFADTAYWNGGIRTDANGSATVEFTLPDNLTTWRLTARGHDLGGKVGEKKSEILVTQDLIARIGKPRFFIEGDTLGLIGIVNSNTRRGLPSVTTEFKVDNLLVAPEQNVKMSLPAFGVASNYYNVKVPEGKADMALFFQAVADKQAKDALRIAVPVYSRGVEYKLYGVGDMGANKVVEMAPLKDTDDFVYRPSELVIALNPSPISQLLRGSEYLANFPYGCIEQTLNGFLPALALKDLLRQRGLAVTQDAKLDAKIKDGVRRIQNFQNEDGSWGWWSGDEGSEFVTGYVLFALSMAKDFKYAVDEARVEKALAAVDRMLQGHVVGGDDGRVFLFYAQTLWGRWNDGAFNEFIRKTNLNPYCRAYLIMAMANAEKIEMGKDRKAAVAAQMQPQLAALKAMQKRDRFGVYWTQADNHPWRWPGGDTEITAHVLSALAAARDNTTLPSQAVISLMKRGKSGAWKSTKETAAVIFSVCRYYRGLSKTAAEKGTAVFTMDGIKIAAIDYDEASLGHPDRLTKKIRLAQAAPEKNFRIEASGTAGADVSFNLTVNGNLYYRENRFLSFLKSGEEGSMFDRAGKAIGKMAESVLSVFSSEHKSLRALDNGLTLVRSYYHATRVRDVNNHEYLVPQFIDDKLGLAIGDEILVKIKFRAQDDLEYLVLEDYLPAGFEVVKKNVYDDYQPYAHSERWDNRMVFFLTKIRKGDVYEIGYTMRAELPGQFLAKPARMECMYEPTIQGWSAPAKFVVHKK